MDVKLFDMFIAVTKKDLSVLSFDSLVTLEDVKIAEKKFANASWLIHDNNKLEIYRKWLDKSKYFLQHQSDLSVGILLIKLLQADDVAIADDIACESLTQIFRIFLVNQENILALTDLIRHTVDSPATFAAFMRCICMNHDNPIKVLESYLLHDYFHYYLYALRYENNEVKALFTLLDSFPETKELATFARQVQSDERGFNSYALDGSADNLELISVAKNLDLATITCTSINLNNLYNLFGIKFLIKLILQWNTLSSRQEYIDFLDTTLNEASFIQNYLPVILNQLLDSDIAHQALATLLDESTIRVLIENKNHAILALVPYLPKLLTIIENQHLDEYLQLTNRQDIYKLTLVTGIMKLIGAWRRNKSDHIGLLLSYLIDTALKIPDVLEDDAILKVIRKFPFAINYCEKIVLELEEKLDLIIDAQSQNNFADFDFISIEDVWRQCFTKIKALHNVDLFPTKLPSDKMVLYTYITKKLNMYHGFIEISNLAELFKIQPEFTEDVSNYERFIVSLLIMLDDFELRQKCIELLDSHSKHSWRKSNYGDLDLYGNAVRSGNLGLITWLHSIHVRPTEAFESLVITAANLHHWHIVAYFNQHVAFKQVIVNTLLHIMVNSSAGEAIESVWACKRHLPSINQIEQSLRLAVGKNDALSVYNILHYLDVPGDDKLASLFKTAVKSCNYDIAKYIAVCKTKNTKKLSDAIDDAFMNSIRKNQGELLHKLVDECHPNMLGKALMAAVRANLSWAVNSLLLSKRPFLQQVINKALVYAKEHNYQSIGARIALYSQENLTNKMPTINIGLISEESKLSKAKSAVFTNSEKTVPKRSQSYETFRFFVTPMSPKKRELMSSSLFPTRLERERSV